MMVPKADDIATTWQSWTDGYAWLRQLPFEAAEHGLWLYVGKRQQSARYLLRDGDVEGFRDLVGKVDDPAVHLEVPLPRATLEPLLPSGWTFAAPEFLMTVAVGPSSLPGLPEEIQLVLDPDVEIRAGCLDRNGHALSRGVCAVFGTDAIFDQIVTEATARRRGFGSAVMAALTAEAVRRGSMRGLLVATVEGRPFYEALGWTVLSEVSKIVSPPDSRQSNHLRVVSGRQV